jgi:photosynthetic reaction center cytochrome c subunit
MSYGLRIAGILAGAVATVLLIGTFERPSRDAVQTGFRGTAMVQNYNPRLLALSTANNTPPEPIARVPAVGPKAGQIYQNVQVLGDLSVGEFTRLMAAITTWVSPEQGCGYCHVAGNMASDDVYTKVVARRMLQMTRAINEQWTAHVGQTGVTCHTCHRGQPVPAYVWTAGTGGGMTPVAPIAAASEGQNRASPATGLTSLPHNGFEAFLLGDANIRVIGDTQRPLGNTASIQQTEWTYGLMMHFSASLGVNCTYCHNSRSFADWTTSSPTRATAWHAIRMVRDINNAYITPLEPVFPESRLGPHGDVLKVNCSTCHQGAYRPLYGAQMRAEYPELGSVTLAAVPGAGPAPPGVTPAAAAAPAAAPAATPAPAPAPAATDPAPAPAR